MVSLRVLILALLLGGCSSAQSHPGRGDDLSYVPLDLAVYRHPVTQEVRYCENVIGLFWWSGPIAYGDCKSELEQQGYLRERTR